MAVVLDASRSGDEHAPPHFYSVSEVAALLGVSRVTVWRWIKSGRLSPARLGHRTVRIQHDDVLRLVEPRPALLAPNPKPLTTTERGHFVMFYEADSYLVKSVAEFVAPALKSCMSALLVATPPH